MLEGILSGFNNFVSGFSPEYQTLISIFLHTIFISIYAIFIWKFYKFLASKEILELNFRQYNYTKHPELEKFFAVLLYTLEYVIILPFLVMFWFTVLSLFLLFLSSPEQTVNQVLLISAAIIASTRITAYIGKDLAKDLAKIFPFTVLALFLYDPSFFDVGLLLEKVSAIPSLFEHIIVFIVFIFIVEFILRAIYSISQVFVSGNKED